MDADLFGKLGLRQLSLTAKLPDFPAYELHLDRLLGCHFFDFYAVEQ